MAEDLAVTCNYLPGVCYTCQKCLYCFILSQKNSCKCKKNKKPQRIKNPKAGQQIYFRAFTPNQSLPLSNKFLFDANNKFNYNSNFEEPFSYTFCGACNSKVQRLRDKDKDKVKKKNKEILVDDDDDKLDASDSTLKELEDNLSSKEEDNLIFEEDLDLFFEEEDNIKEINIIQNKNIKTPTAKSLVIKPVDYKNVVEKINLVVQKNLGKKITPKDYTISYKAVNARGPSNELEDELDFQEFIDEYKKVISVDKKMSVIVVTKVI